MENKIICSLCSSIRSKLLFYQFYNKTAYYIFKCLNCKLVFLYPRPANPISVTEEHISLLTFEKGDIFTNSRDIISRMKNFVKMLTLKYQFGYYSSIHIKNCNHIKNNLLYLLTLPLKYRFDFIFPVLKKNGKLLDIGCGSGYRLNQLRTLGWEVYGVEPSSELANFGREKFHLKIYQSSFEEAKFYPNEFDVVTLYHVLEHVSQPEEFLLKIHNTLKTDGELLVAIPNINSLERIIFGRYWNAWVIPWHLWFFSEKTLTQLLHKTNYDVVKIEYQPVPQIIIWSFYNLLSSFLKNVDVAKKILKNFFYNFSLFYMTTIILTPFSLMCALLKFSSCIVIHAKKRYHNRPSRPSQNSVLK